MVDVLLVSLVLATVVVGLIVGFVIGRALTARSKELEFKDREKVARKDSVQKSRSTLTGQFLEKLSPHFPDFPYNPTEVRFIGTPVDYVVFRGLSTGVVEEVVFLEVKSGDSGLSTDQRRVRDAVKAGRVRWDEYRTPE